MYSQLAAVEEDICALADCIEYSLEVVRSPATEPNIGGANYPTIEYGYVLTAFDEADVRYPLSCYKQLFIVFCKLIILFVFYCRSTLRCNLKRCLRKMTATLFQPVWSTVRLRFQPLLYFYHHFPLALFQPLAQLRSVKSQMQPMKV